MKRVVLDVPDLTSLIAITYVYEDEVTWSQMVGVSIITRADNPDVMSGKEAYIVRASDRRTDDDRD